MSAVSGYAWAPCTCDWWGCEKCAPVIIPKRLRVDLKSDEDWERTNRALNARLVNEAHVEALKEDRERRLAQAPGRALFRGIPGEVKGLDAWSST